ncbi:MAG: aldehyde dehydrogenase [Rubrivivax sp.]|nr:aldehyde dehydrogenase [Rubrivivax sp.]
MFQVRLMLGDKDANASEGAVFERRDPISGEVVSQAAAASVADAQAAANAAAAAFPGWSNTSPSQRRAVLSRAADLLVERTPEFVKAMTLETGAAPMWGAFNCKLAAGMLREAAALTTQITGEVIPSDKPGFIAMALRQPAGVCVGIAPWNAPVILGVRAIAVPLACGNTVVLKSAEMCPMTHWLIASVLRAAGLPPGAVNVISNAPQDAKAVVDALIAHPAVRRVNFTGSTRVGRLVAQSCALHLKPVLLELGGKAPLVVLDDADLDAAVNAAAFGAYMNQGQICMSTERIIVDESVADEFVARLAAKTRTLRAGVPGTEGCVLGSMIGRDAAQRVRSMIDDAVHKGARLVTGGEIDGTILQPALIDHLTPAMQLYRDESFGPVAGVVRVQSVEEAISVANDTEYGLAAAVFGRDVNRALAVARQIDSGICHINSATVQDEAQMPFGGVKGSGYGRFGGKAGIEEFTELRWLSLQTETPHYPF